MARKYPIIYFEGCQFKSVQKLKLLAKLLDTMEKEFGIKVCQIGMTDCFVCPDIDLKKLLESKKPMERIVAGILLTIKRKSKK